MLDSASYSSPSPSADDNAVDNDSTGTLKALLSQVESFKNRGNIEFRKGKMLAKHTAGKNFLVNACTFYGQGIEVLAKADACLTRLQKSQQQVSGMGSPPSNLDPSSARYQDNTTGNGGLSSTPLLASLATQADAVRSSVYLNLAACNLLLHKWNLAVACCTFVIEECGEGITEAAAASKVPVQEEPPSGNRHNCNQEARPLASQAPRNREIAAKALYRRSAANVEIGDAHAAKEDLVRALRLKPGDALISRELKKATKAVADADAKECLRRETEEGKLRRQQQRQHHHQQPQQQEQQQQNTSSLNSSADDSCFLAKERDAMSTPSRTAEETTIPKHAGTATPSTAPQDGSSIIDNIYVDAGDENIESSSSSEGENREEQELGRQGGDAAGEKDDEPFPTRNGGECRDGLYAWNQSVDEVQVSVNVPDWARASDVRVDIRRSRLSVALSTERGSTSTFGDSNSTVGKTEGHADIASRSALNDEDRYGIVLSGALSRPVQVDECLWTMERPGRVHLYLQKELPADGEPGSEWWATVMKGDEEIDVLTCDAGSIASKYPEHARRRGAKALWEHQRKTPQERRKEERLREARQHMEEEAEERQRDLENALKDPKKAEMYQKLREEMPDTFISIK